MTAQPPLRQVLLTGDVHGNTPWVVDHVPEQAKRQRCQIAMVMEDSACGADAVGSDFLDGVERAAAAAGISVWFIDGNHEDFNLLYSPPLDDAFRCPVRDHILHISRGHRWTWAERAMLAYGGASSVEVMSRLPR